MKEKVDKIKQWLGQGSINIFGLPMSGKDTVGVRLAEVLDGRFLSSGLIIRAAAQEGRDGFSITEYAKGALTPTDLFSSWVLPYFHRPELKGFPLILSSVGRWSGEEDPVMKSAENSGHPIKAVVLLNVSEDDVRKRWQVAQSLNDRNDRSDDKAAKIFDTRLSEFYSKTMPVIEHYRQLELIVPVVADKTREEVFAETVERLYRFATDHL
jgi:adenylate kinase